MDVIGILIIWLIVAGLLAPVAGRFIRDHGRPR